MTCARCGEEITAAERPRAAELPHLSAEGASVRVYHYECHLRQIVGSVGHQLGLCTCHGGPGTMDDPPGMTKRQAAIEAVQMWRGAHFQKTGNKS